MKTCSFARHPRAVPKLEAFVRSIPFLSQGEADRAVILGTETLDNIISYSVKLRTPKIVLRVRKTAGEISLIFWFKSDNFSCFARHADSEGGQRVYDPVLRRYRGLGLAMSRALSRVYRARSDSKRDAIIIRF